MAPPPTKPVCLKDIAKAVGLSHGAVSLALRNNEKIPEATRLRVQSVARQMSYHPNPMAAGLAHFKRTSTVKPVQAALAWLNLWPEPHGLRKYRHFDLYWDGASKAAAKFGYHLEEFRAADKITPKRLQQILLTRDIHGILLPPIRLSLDWTDFDWELFSGVTLSRWTPGIRPLHLVTSAQSTNAAFALVKVQELGYERIGYVGLIGDGWTYSGGFLQAQVGHIPEKLRVPPLFFSSQSSAARSDEKYGLFASWFKKWKPDAIITEQIAVAELLKRAGLRVPDDVGVAALNVLDMPFDAGIDQNAEEIGRVASLMLISLINDNDRGIPSIQREILIKGNWIDGSSLPRHK